VNASAVTALIFSAGYSSRMGHFKPLLSFNGVSTLERVVTVFATVGVRDIRVVVGYRAEELFPVLKRLGVTAILNPYYQEGMFSSVLAGLKTLEKDRKAFFIMPVDVPLVRSRTIRDVLQRFEQTETLVFPVFEGRRGHPPLVATRYVEPIVSWNGEGGLRECLKQFDHEAAEVEVADEFILCDMDTPEDFQRLARRCNQYDIPSVAECLMLLEKKYCVGKRGMDHALGVARIAVRLGKALSRSGIQLNIPLIAAGALLHDLAKGKTDHAAAGAKILDGLGFSRVAEIVSKHMDLGVFDDRVIGETEVVYLADKLVQAGGRATSLESRFEEKLRRFGHNPEARRAIAVRQENALRIRSSLETQLGPLEAILIEPEGPDDYASTVSELVCRD